MYLRLFHSQCLVISSSTAGSQTEREVVSFQVMHSMILED